MDTSGSPSVSLVLAIHITFVLVAYARSQPIAEDGRFRLSERIPTLLRELPNNTTVGIAALDRRSDSIYQYNAKMELPTASSVKPHMLLDLFGKYSSEWDRVKREDVQTILKNGSHPAITHFSDDDKKLIGERLWNVSIKQLGKILIDSEDQEGKQYKNVVYNAASNVGMALLGGPEKASASIHRRHEAFSEVNIRRYMLADRNVTGDNTATPLGLATLFRLAMSEELDGVPSEVLREFTTILHFADDDDGGKLYAKGGSLHTDLVTCVRAGQYQLVKRRMSFAIMATQTLESANSGKSQFEALNELMLKVYALVKTAE